MADNQFLYLTAMHGAVIFLFLAFTSLLFPRFYNLNSLGCFSVGNQAKIISWDSLSWKRIGTKKVAREPISAFNVSMDGKHLAM